MKRKALIEYEEKEIDFISQRSKNIVLKKKIDSPFDLYPELSIPESLTYGGGNVPLVYLLLLYEKIALYIPPAKKETLEEKWGVPYETIIRLCETKHVQPLIGHPPEYASEYFSPLLKLNPPSVWARGSTLLGLFGYGDTLDESKCPLPISKMAGLPDLIAKYQKHYPFANNKQLHFQIRRELLTLYADLWLFGEGEFAENLKYLREPSLIVNRLFLSNQIISYPILFGLNGTPNFDLQSLNDTHSISNELKAAPSNQTIIPKDLGLLLNSLSFKTTNLSPEQIIDFHSSGSGKELRTALTKFEKKAKELIIPEGVDVDINAIIAAAEYLEQQIQALSLSFGNSSYRKDIKSVKQTVDYSIRVGSIVLGGIVFYFNPEIGVFSLVSNVYERVFPDALKDKIVDYMIDKKFSPGISNLWKIANKK